MIKLLVHPVFSDVVLFFNKGSTGDSVTSQQSISLINKLFDLKLALVVFEPLL